MQRLRAKGLTVGAAGNVPRGFEEPLREHVDVLGSSALWGVEKPAPAFFERIEAELGVAAREIAYVGDRVDNDVLPSSAAGMRPIWIRRGPWGVIQQLPAGVRPALVVDSLAELAERIGEAWD